MYNPDLPDAYRVTWEIDVDAASPLEAAHQAEETMKDPESIATVFDVLSKDGALHTVDLLKGTVDARDEPDWKAAIEQIRDLLWLEGDKWNPDKEWDSETIENVAAVLEALGLKPKTEEP